MIKRVTNAPAVLKHLLEVILFRHTTRLASKVQQCTITSIRASTTQSMDSAFTTYCLSDTLVLHPRHDSVLYLSPVIPDTSRYVPQQTDYDTTP